MKALAIVLYVVSFLVGCGIEPMIASAIDREDASDCCWDWPDTDAIDRCFAPYASPYKCQYLHCPLFDYDSAAVCPEDPR